MWLSSQLCAMQDKNLSTICCPASKHSQSNSAAKASGAGECFSIKVLFTVEKRAWMFTCRETWFWGFLPINAQPHLWGAGERAWHGDAAAILSYFKIKPCLYCALRMAFRNRGCVNEGSSPSAWPLARFQQKNKYLPGFWEVDQPFLNGKEIAGVVNSPRGSPLVGTHEKPNDDNVSFRAMLFAKMFLKFYLLT